MAGRDLFEGQVPASAGRDLFAGQDLSRGVGRDLFAAPGTSDEIGTSAIPLAFKAALPAGEVAATAEGSVIPESAYLGIPPRISEPLPTSEIFPKDIGDEDDDRPLWEKALDLVTPPTREEALLQIGKSIRPLALLGDVRKGAIESAASMVKGVGGAMTRDALPDEHPVYKVGKTMDNYAKALDPYINLAQMPELARWLAGGVGSLVPYGLGGYFGGLASRGLAWAYPGLMGSFQIRNELQEDALAHKATPEEATLAGDIGGYIGASEALLPGAVFGKIALKAGGQKFIDALAKMPQKVRDGLIKGTIVAGGSVTEGLQEGFEQLMQNMTAADWIGYDPDREPTEFLKEAIGLGAGSAGIAMALMQLFTGKRYSPSPRGIPDLDVTPDSDDVFHASSTLLNSLPDPDKTPTIPLKRLRRIMGQQNVSAEEQALVGEYTKTLNMRDEAGRLVNKFVGLPGVVDEAGNVDVAKLRDVLQQHVFPIRPQSGLGWIDYGHGPWQGHPNAVTPNHQRRPLLTTAVPRLKQLEQELRARVDAGNPLTPEEYEALIVEDVTQEPGRQAYVKQDGDPLLRNVLWSSTGNRMPAQAAGRDMAQLTNSLRVAISNSLDPRVTLPSGTLTWRAPFPTFTKHTGANVHPNLMTQDYIGHTRYFVDALTDPEVIYFSEIQTDRKQKEIKELRLLHEDARQLASLKAQLEDIIADQEADPLDVADAKLAVKEFEKEAKKRGTWEKLQAKDFDADAVKVLISEERLLMNEVEKARSDLATLQELTTLAEKEKGWPGTTDLWQRLESGNIPHGWNLNNAAASEGLDGLIAELETQAHHAQAVLKTTEINYNNTLDEIVGAAEQHLIERPSEQSILNYEAQESVRWAARQGYKAVRIPTAQTSAVVQSWETKKGNARYLTPEQVRALVIDPKGTNKGDFYGTDPKTGKPEATGSTYEIKTKTKGTRARRAQQLTNAIEQHFLKAAKRETSRSGRRQTTSREAPRIVQDRYGYEWLEIPIVEGMRDDVTFMYGFPGQVPEILTEGMAALAKGTKQLFTKLNLNEPSRADALNEDLDRYNKGIRIYNTLTQLAKINMHIPGMKSYVEGVRRFWNTKSRWLSRADERLKDIMDLPSKDQKSLFRLALAVTVESEKRSRRLTDEEILEVGRRSGANPNEQTMLVYEAMDADFRAALEELYNVLVAERQKNFANNAAALRTAMIELNREFGKLRNKNFFPLSRFGKQYVTVRTMVDTQLDGVRYKAGDVIDFRTFEGLTAKAQQRSFYKKMQKESQSRRIKVSAGEFQEEIRGLIGLPPQAIELFRKNVNLTDEQKTQLADLVTQLSPATSFMRHMIERKATPGFSLDGIRGYADYFQKFSNYIARETHKGELSDSVNEMKDSIKEMDRLGKDHTKRDGIVSHLQRHMDYLYDPGNEAATLRAAAFTFYLGAVVKSAYVNLTQPILVTYPYLAARYGAPVEGDVKAVYNISKSYVDLAGDKVAAVLSRAMGDATEGLVRPELIEPELAEAISRGVQDGFLEESFATEVAGTAEGNLVSRMMPSSGVGRTTRRIGYYSSWLFQQAERLNRRVAFIAAFRLARGMIGEGRRWVDMTRAEREAVYEAARDSVESTQYEYARWNRAEFMRGPTKSLIFTFYQYIQNTLFFATKDPGRGRFLLVMLVTAGLMGLPGAEDLVDLLDAVLTKFPGLAKRLGLGDKPMVDLRLSARETLAELTDPDTADLILHGVSRKYGLGPLHMAQLAGIPVPNVDLSASLSLGRVLPAGPEYLRDLAYGKDSRTALQEATVDMAGAAFAIPLTLMQMMGETHSDKWKTYERALPTAMKHAVKAWRYWKEGEDYDRSNATIVEFDVDNPVEFAEIIAAGAGFPPERLTREKDLRWNQIEHARFYQARRSIIKKNIIHHTWVRPDEERLAEAEKALQQFNASAPPELRISRKEIAQQWKTQNKGIIKSEMGIPRNKKMYQEFKRIERAYEGTDRELPGRDLFRSR